MPKRHRQHESPFDPSYAIGEEIMSMTKISPDMTIREIALLPEFSGFGEHIMLCRQETWARIQKTKVGAMIENSGSQYQLGRFIRGFQNIVDLADAGHRIAFDFWDEPSCIMDPSRRQTKLFFFPGKPGAPFALVLSGGGYQSVCNNLEGFPVAPELTDAGLNVFVLSYRVRRKHLMPWPLDDVAQALSYISCHRKAFDVGSEYLVMGFSAGAHLAAEWGTENKGYAHYGLPKPSALVLCYAPIDLMTFMDAEDHRFLDSVCLEEGHGDIHDWCINEHVWKGYPATYLWKCSDDPIISDANYADMDTALARQEIQHQVTYYSNGGHALLAPHSEEADHWLDAALQFAGEHIACSRIQSAGQ